MGESGFDATVRVQIYRTFAKHGRAPVAAEVAGCLGCDAPDVEQACVRLAATRVIVLEPGTASIWMAHPFSAVPTAYRVEAGAASYWANCAWDAIGIATMLGRDTQALARCPDCDEPVDLSVRGGRIADPTAVLHFSVPWKRFWENIGAT